MKKRITSTILQPLMLFLLLFGGSSFAALNGTYTINKNGTATSTNYLSVTAAVADLMAGTRTDGGTPNGPGVSGPVTLRIVANTGPYNEQIAFGPIAGTNKNKFVRLTGGPTREEISFSGTTTTARGVITLTGTKNIILDSLTLTNTDATYAYGVHITNNADSNWVKNSIITVPNNSTSANMAGIVISSTTSATGSGNNGDYNTVQGNVVSGGYYGYTATGTSTTVYSQENHVIGNEFKEFYYYGIRHYEQNLGIIRGNTVHARPSGTASGYGMYIYYNDRFTVEQNNLYNVGTYGIYCYYANYQGGSSSSRATLRNNMIGGSWLAASPYGMYLTTNTVNVDIFHNSISLTSGNGRGFYLIAGTGNNVRNNSFSVINSTSGYAAYVSSTAYLNGMDYNNYYCPGSSGLIYLAGAYTTTNYQGAAGFNTNSTDGDPLYIDPVSNLHAYATQLFDGGDPTVGVTNDFDGDVRPHPTSTIPDIGADEYLPDSVDITMDKIVAPAGGACPDSMEVVKVILSNRGLNTKSNIPVQVTISGAGSAVLNVVYPGPMALGDVDTVTVGTFNSWPGGNFNFSAIVSVANDQSHGNDTLVKTIGVNLTPAAPTVPSTTICEGDSTMLIATSTGTNFWYDAPSGGNLIYTGDTISTGPLSSPMTYYTEARGTAVSTVTTTFANNNSCGGGNMFDIIAIAEVTLDSFDINISGSASVNVYYKVGTYLGSETNAGAWTLLGTANVIGAGTGNPSRLVVPPLTVPAGQTYGIFINTTTMVYTTLSAGTYYNTPELSLYSGTGLCGAFSGTNFPRGWNGRVYYSAIGCASPRTAVNVGVNTYPVVSLADTTHCGPATLDAGNPGASYMWSNGDTTQTSTISSSSLVSVTVMNGTCATADSADVTIGDFPTVNLGADQLLCDGASATLDAGNAGNSYLWSDNSTSQTLTVTAAGTYSVVVTTPESCTGTDAVTITTLNSPAGTLSADLSGCPTVAFTSTSTGGAATTSSWDFGDGSTGTGSNPSHTYTADGSYTVTFTQTNDCGTDVVTQTITVDCLTGIDGILAGQVVLFPNPAKDRAELALNLKGATLATISLTDLQGKVMNSQSKALGAGNNTIQLDLSGLSSGMYLVKINSDSFSWNGQLVKN
ncbi:MAG: right-handed parallel beta-helix repeat-containing protein [Bacteroidia bacterium]|nr:right-handed parallel beta-helix repeat-containing protein [Bacteroidia bacterium]